MRFLSVCSGIEAASSAWKPLGWQAVAFSEIEPFPCAVLAHHYPDVPNYGDMTKFKDWPDHAIDLLCGGTPCQSFSVAGLRKGLDDPRGNLMLTYGAIAAKYRPKWLVWENVPGVLSSNGGRDFGTFLGMLGQLGYGFAYRVLDAGNFGIPLSRRRVFLVACLDGWRSPAAVLFERASFRDVRASGSWVPAIDASGLAKRQTMPERGRCWTVHDGIGHRFLTPNEVERLLGFPKDYTNVEKKNRGEKPRGKAKVEPQDEIRHNPGAVQHDAGQAERCLCALRRADGSPGRGSLSSIHEGSGDSLPPLQHKTSSSGGHGLGDAGVGLSGRRPRVADGPRYKALGNSWAVPVAAWIGRRIDAVEAITSQQRTAA